MILVDCRIYDNLSPTERPTDHKGVDARLKTDSEMNPWIILAYKSVTALHQANLFFLADMQRHEGMPDAGTRRFNQHALVEMQAGRWRRDGAGISRIHGLVALAVVLGVRARDVRRQRHLARILQPPEQIRAAVGAAGRDLESDRRWMVRL